MSVISLADAKAFLDVIHGSDDTKIQNLLDGAEDEAAKFMGAASLEDWSELPMSIVVGVMLLLQANYQADVDDIGKFRAAAETKLMPYRDLMGV